MSEIKEKERNLKELKKGDEEKLLVMKALSFDMRLCFQKIPR